MNGTTSNMKGVATLGDLNILTLFFNHLYHTGRCDGKYFQFYYLSTVAKIFSIKSFTLVGDQRMLTEGCEQTDSLTAEQCSEKI